MDFDYLYQIDYQIALLDPSFKQNMFRYKNCGAQILQIVTLFNKENVNHLSIL